MKLRMFALLAFALSGVAGLTACSTTQNLLPATGANKEPGPGVGYQVTDLGPAESPFSQATWLNNSGVVTGFAIGSDGASHAIFWSNGTLEDISQPALGGPNSGAYAINQSGQVVGQAETSA